MRRFIVFFLYSVLVSVASKLVNYCGSKMCRNTNTHTFCQYSPGPNPECTGFIPALLSDQEKARIMSRLNRRRNEAALGRLRGMPSAGNMMKLRWVEELAREAQLWADQCRPPATPEEHDICRDLYSTTVGQCVASVVGEAPGLRVESMIDMWYMQSMLYKGNVTSYVAPLTEGSYYGDFGQMMWSRAYMVGCGRSRFMTLMGGRMRSVERLVCNLAPRGPVQSRALWMPALPATACPPRSVPDNILTGLCNFHPDFDQTEDTENTFTLEEHITINTILDIERNESLGFQGNLDKMYLTSLAIATIANPVTTPMYYNTVQKRDIVELIELEELHNDLNKVIPNENIIKIVNFTGGTETVIDNINKNKLSLVKMAKIPKEVKLVGRPKTYNIEELTNAIGDESKDNDRNDHTEDIEKMEKEIYDEYSFLEVLDENTTISSSGITEMPSTFESVKKENSELTNTNIAFSEATVFMLLSFNPSRDVINTTAASIITKSINLDTDTTTEWSSKNQRAEDYLDDPETVRELHEALERMERTLEPPIQHAQGKVRRELRDLQAEQYPSLDTADKKMLAKYYLSPEADAMSNNTLDRGPVMNMMLKYVPYIKDYQHNLLSKPGNRGSFVGPHLFLIFTSLIW